MVPHHPPRDHKCPKISERKSPFHKPNNLIRPLLLVLLIFSEKKTTDFAVLIDCPDHL